MGQQWGYGKFDSEELTQLWLQQAKEKIQNKDFILGKLDSYGQRIDIEIVLPGKGDAAGKVSHITSGWIIYPDGSVSLATPFSGFTRGR